jgi:hypothetical protein
LLVFILRLPMLVSQRGDHGDQETSHYSFSATIAKEERFQA